QFDLNKEQERAFRIVGNHATSPFPEQLKMYLGGMGGTSKSQVIKALIAMFDAHNESHCLIILAPTGSAAALLNGFTYHYALGVYQSEQKNDLQMPVNANSKVNETQECLRGVEYIFIDKISMVGCNELFNIS
ncbi:hypothetical protein BDQ12DRAFT_572208, partial [Crucibulum laeve]